MLELMKELGFIPESRAIKIYERDGVIVGERYDRVTYLREELPIQNWNLNEPVFVECGRFLPLLPFISSVANKENYLEVILRNGAEYKLPYLDISFERPVLPDVAPEVQITGTIDFSVLKKTALQNLVKPEMRCIYVDNRGAVSCNFLQGTVDTGIRSASPLLLPPDLVDYIPNGQDGMICSIDDFLFYTDTHTFWIWAPKSDITEEESPWYETIYADAMEVQAWSFSQIPQDLENALKRLSYFGTDVAFYPDKVQVENNFEPLGIAGSTGDIFTIDEVVSVLPYGKEIYFVDGIMYLRNGTCTICVSKKEEE